MSWYTIPQVSYPIRVNESSCRGSWNVAILLGISNQTIIPPVPVRYEIVIAQLREQLWNVSWGKSFSLWWYPPIYPEDRKKFIGFISLQSIYALRGFEKGQKYVQCGIMGVKENVSCYVIWPKSLILKVIWTFVLHCSINGVLVIKYVRVCYLIPVVWFCTAWCYLSN